MMKTIVIRPYVVGAALILQLAWFFVTIEYLSGIFAPVSFIVQVISIVALLMVLNKWDNPAFQLPWAILILTTPILGGIVYFLTSGSGLSNKMRKAYDRAMERAKGSCAVDLGRRLPEITDKESCVSGQFKYLERAGFPLYGNTGCRYYAMADDAFPDLLEALESAQRYIFLEYFIINQSSMWAEILSVLERKAAQGVDVRVLYDDLATISNLPKRYPRILEEKGIRCVSFNPFIPFVSVTMNNRDHRKIAVIDGRIAFTGGFNLSDEYINREHPFGESWKDAGIRLEGEAAWQMALVFLTMWQSVTDDADELDQYRPLTAPVGQDDGFVQPYAHAPLEGNRIVGDVYRNIINQARDYLYIYTPYLIPDTETMSALILAARRGVDVRIVLPGVPDKKMIYRLSEASGRMLQDHSIKVYAYTPGFLHAKCVVSDDMVASVGTANFDNRSLHHSFENGCLFYRSSIVDDLRDDFRETLSSCRLMRRKPVRFHVLSGVYYAVLRVFSPLL